MQRLNVKAGVYVCRTRPQGARAVEALIDQALEGYDGAPDMIYWDMEVKDREQPVGAVRFGEGDLDLLLASTYDLSAGVAVNARSLKALAEKGAGQSPADLGRAIRLLARSPSFRAVRCPGLSSTAALSECRPVSAGPENAASVEATSVAVLSDSDDDDLGAILDALASQSTSARMEIVVLISGPEPTSSKARVKTVDDWMGAHARVRVRRFIIWGEFSRAYLTNTAVALATGEVVVVMDPRCMPGSSRLVQALANAADGAHVATVCPRIERGGTLLAAGLALRAGADDAPEATPFAMDVFSDGVRLCAAPTPWVFATRRRNWVGAGGVHTAQTELWTAVLAGATGPKGRHLLAGAQSVEWTGALPLEGVEQAAPAPRRLRPSSASALQLADDAGILAAPDAAPGLRAPPLKPRAAVPVAATGAQPSPVDQPAFSDARGADAAGLRLLIIADAFGPSQAIAFTEGLAEARRSGQASVTLYAEADLAPATAQLDRRVETAFADADPTVVVVSRLAEPRLWQAVRTAARRRGLPILLHVDDDLFDPPLTLGIERYRIARQPRRLHTLHAILQDCDLALASTELLAAKLLRLAGHGRIAVMPIGAAARAPAFRTPRRRSEVVVGYMGSASHNADLAMIAPALNRVCADERRVRMVLFGSIAKQPARRLLTGDVETEPGVFGDYPAFKRRLADLGFDIGLAPLADNAFNRAKTPVKWLEYGEAGAAVLASDVAPYRPMAEAGALISVREDGWEAALRGLIDDADRRDALVARTDRMIRRDYGWDRLESGMLRLLRTLAPSNAEAA